MASEDEQAKKGPDQIDWQEEFETFYRLYKCNGYEALRARDSMSWSELKKQWHKRLREVHSDKTGGGDAETKMVNGAWELLKHQTPTNTKNLYDEYLQKFPSYDAWAAKQTGGTRDPEDPQAPPGPEAHEFMRDARAFLEKEGFDDVSEDEVGPLMEKLERILERALWSHFGFYFNHGVLRCDGVLICDTVNPITFMLWFLAGDLAQAVTLMIVISISTEKTGALILVPVGEFLLTVGIALRVYYRQVLESSEVWSMDYVVASRVRYWIARGVVAALLAIACCIIEFSVPLILYILVFRLFLAASQYLTHERCRTDSWLFTAVSGTEERIPEMRTNLLIYYDSWLNSFCVCLFTSVIGWFTVNIVICLLIFELTMIILHACCSGDSEEKKKKKKDEEDDDDGGSCWTFIFLVAMLNCSSACAYKLANWRLKEMQEAWDKEDGQACHNAYQKWVEENFEREKQRLIRRRDQVRRKQQERQQEKAAAAGHSQQKSDQPGEASPDFDNDGEVISI